MGDLRDQVALITGASRGIGRAAAVALAAAGARVVLVGRDRSALAASAGETREAASLLDRESPNHLILTADLSDPDAIRRIISETTKAFGALHILVNNAGIGIGKPFKDTTLDDWDQTQVVNLRSACLCAQEAVEVMRKAGGGRIINVISASALVGMPGLSAYTAAKGGLLSLTRTMAVELARDGINVNAVCPGYILTDMSRDFLRSESGQKYIRQNVPLRRPGEPKDVAAAILFLASPMSDYITGAVLPVDGGQTAK